MSMFLTNLRSYNGASFKAAIFSSCFDNQAVVGTAVSKWKEDMLHFIVPPATQMLA